MQEQYLRELEEIRYQLNKLRLRVFRVRMLSQRIVALASRRETKLMLRLKQIEELTSHPGVKNLNIDTTTTKL